MINWADPKQMLSTYFSVREALYLPTWGRMADESDGLNDTIKNNLLDLCSKLDLIRELLGCPMLVHCMYRPTKYNELVGGAPASAHLDGKAIDFDLGQAMPLQKARLILVQVLDKYELRMEDNGPAAGWIHLDTAPVVHNRYFKP